MPCHVDSRLRCRSWTSRASCSHIFEGRGVPRSQLVWFRASDWTSRLAAINLLKLPGSSRRAKATKAIGQRRDAFQILQDASLITHLYMAKFRVMAGKSCGKDRETCIGKVFDNSSKATFYTTVSA